MVEEEVIRFKHAYLQMKIDNMDNYVKEYKKSVDKCNPAGISLAAASIGELRELLKNEKQYLSIIQENEIDNLDREFANQFQRLGMGKVCECKQKNRK
jgi:endo-alpha-1,4-polygalactosaminidase (GH114 family)